MADLCAQYRLALEHCRHVMRQDRVDHNEETRRGRAPHLPAPHPRQFRPRLKVRIGQPVTVRPS